MTGTRNKYQTLLSNTAILGIGTFASKLLVYFLMPLYTSCLSPDQFSRADLITQTANLLLPILAVGICDAVFRFTLDRAYHRTAVLSTGMGILVLGTLVGIPITLLLGCFSYFRGGWAWLVLGYVLASNFHSLCANYLRAEGRNVTFAVQGIFTTAITILLNLIFLLGLKMTVTGYVLSVVLADALVGAVLFSCCGIAKRVRPHFFSHTLAAQMLRYSAPLIPTTIFWWATNVSDRYMIVYFHDDALNGLYSAAFKIPTLLILASGIFIEAWHFSAVSEGKRERSRFFSTVFDSFQALMFMACAGLCAGAKICASLLFADSYYTAWQFMPMLLLATVFSSLVTFMGSVYLVEKKSMNSFYTALIGAAVNLVLNLVLIPHWGAHGAAAATFTCYFVVFAIRAVNTQKMIRFNLHPTRLIINTLLCAVQCCLILAEVKWWILWQILLVAAVLVINLRPIISGAMQVLRRR